MRGDRVVRNTIAAEMEQNVIMGGMGWCVLALSYQISAIGTGRVRLAQRQAICSLRPSHMALVSLVERISGFDDAIKASRWWRTHGAMNGPGRWRRQVRPQRWMGSEAALDDGLVHSEVGDRRMEGCLDVLALLTPLFLHAADCALQKLQPHFR